MNDTIGDENVDLMGVCLIGVHLMSAYLMAHGHASHRRGSYGCLGRCNQ